MNKAIFLDRDGTINVEKHYLYKISDFEFMPGVIGALRELQKAGYILIIVTNQSGIARGYYTESDFRILNEWMLQVLKEQGVDIAHVYYCPHLPDAQIEKYRKECQCRKPKLGMYQQAIDEFKIDLKSSYAIGDKMRDCAICNSTLCRGFLIGDSEKSDVITDVLAGKFERVRYANNLCECARKILNE